MNNKRKTYTVKPGDTLSEIKMRVLKQSGWTGRNEELYRLNMETICKEQLKRDPSHSGPDWIYPGTILILPL